MKLILHSKHSILHFINCVKTGWHGIPPELYLAFSDIIGPSLLDMINTAYMLNEGAFSSGANTAIITVLPKSNKDPSQRSNYRPLSILNGDVKLFAKVLATRLEICLTKLIHNDQTGFIKTRLASDNVHRLLHIIHAASAIDFPCSSLSLDAEKAFDRLGLHRQYLLHPISYIKGHSTGLSPVPITFCSLSRTIGPENQTASLCTSYYIL